MTLFSEPSHGRTRTPAELVKRIAAAAALPPRSGARIWEACLLDILADLAGSGWHRCAVRKGATAAVAMLAAQWPAVFVQPLYFMRAGCRALNWHDVFLVGRPPELPAELPTAPGIWYGARLGLVLGGSTGLLLCNETLAERPTRGYRKVFVRANVPGGYGERGSTHRMHAERERERERARAMDALAAALDRVA